VYLEEFLYLHFYVGPVFSVKSAPPEFLFKTPPILVQKTKIDEKSQDIKREK